MTLQDLPALNALLNTLSTIFLVSGWIFIKRGKKIAHRNCMLGALVASTIFLTCYLIYHFNAGRTVFVEPPWARPIYLGILIPHTILAVVIVPLIIMSVTRAVKERWELHKKIARWTMPLWLFVSVTGVVIYLMLYQIWPQAK